MNRSQIKQLVTSEKWLVLADQVVVSGSAFLTNLLLAQTLGLTAYGQFSAVVLTQLFLLSIQQAVGSGIYQVVWPGLPVPLQKSYTNGFLYFQVAWLLVLALVGAGLFSLLPIALIPYETSFLLAAAGTTGLFLFQDFLRKVLLVQQRAGRALLLDGLANGSQLILLLVFHRQGSLSLEGALLIIGATFLPSAGLGVFWLTPSRFRKPEAWLVCGYYRQQGNWMLLSALTQWFAGNYFIVAGGWLLGAATLGALRLAQYIFGLLNVLLQALESYVVPRAALVAHSPATLRAYLQGVLLKSLLGLLPALLLLVVGAEPLLRLVGGSDYQTFSYVMYGLSAVYVLVVCSYPIRIILRVRFLTKQYFAGYVLATVFSLSSASWLVSAYQLTGILIGLFLTQAILISYWLWVLHQNSLFEWKSFTLFSARPIRPE
ncbi:lipopolysaccharide biosynthesis protein [Spirosoma aerophilum]